MTVNDKTSTQPKYLAIANQLIHSIRKGELAPGARIPSENEIIAASGVSNTTARKALSYLESHGWIRRQRGSGSFVHPRCLDLSLDRILDFDASVLLAGGTPSTRLVSFQSAEETPLLRVAGNTYALEGLVHRIERLSFADGVPMMLEKRYVSAVLCPDIDQHDLTGPLYELYEQTYGLILSEVHQDLSVVTLDSGRTMDQFELDKPIPAIRVQGATLSTDGRIVELEDAFYRSDRYRFTVVAHR
jgi:GntR family transcriptional regulator